MTQTQQTDDDSTDSTDTNSDDPTDEHLFPHTVIPDGMDPIARHWIPVLAECWMQTDWDRFNQQQRRVETFGQRYRRATKQADVNAALKKLSRGLGIGSPELPTVHLDPLVENDREAMDALRHEEVFLVNKTSETVANYFANREADGETEPAQTTTDLSDFVPEDQ